MITTTAAITLAVTLATWGSPASALVAGNVGLYGDWLLVRSNALYHGYVLDGYTCGGSLMSPADIGKTFWLRLPSGAWRGHCLAVDCSQRLHFYDNVYVRREVAEVDADSMAALGQRWRAWTEVYIGECPFGVYGPPQLYRPQLEFDTADPHGRLSYSSAWWPFAAQGTYCQTGKRKE